MKNCTDCGCELDDGVEQCPLCGATVPTDGGEETLTIEPPEEGSEAPELPEGEEEKAGRGRKRIFVGLGIAAALVLAVWLIFGLLRNPRDQFLLQHKKLFQAMGENEFSFLLDGARSRTDYSLDMTVTAEVEGTGDAARTVNSALADSAAHLKLDMDETSCAVDGDILLGGEPFLSGSLRYDGEAGTMGFYFPELSDKYYIADYVALLENLTGQESGLENAPTTGEETKAAYERMIKTYGGILQNVVKKSNVTKESGRYSIFVIRNDWKATAYVCKPTAKDLEELFLDLADALEADQDLPRFVSALDEETRERLVSDLRENAGDMAKTLAAQGFTWTIRTNDRGNYQVEICWSQGGGHDAWIRFERTPDTLYFSWVGVDASSRDEVSEIWMTCYGDNVAGYHGNLYVTDRMPFEFENVHPEKTSALFVPYGDYKFSTEDSVLMTLNVTAADGGTDHILRVSDFDSASGIGNVTVDIHTTDKPVTLSQPEGPVEDITSYTAEDFETLGRTLTQKLFGLVLSRGMSR